MKLVIDISEEYYKTIKETKKEVVPIGWVSIQDGIKYEERPHGQWICNEDGNYECSECGIAWKDMPAKDAKPVFKACPWCGADMRSEEGE